MIGVNPQKLSATIEVVDSRERKLGGGGFAIDRAGYAAMVKYAEAWPQRLWANGASGHWRSDCARVHLGWAVCEDRGHTGGMWRVSCDPAQVNLPAAALHGGLVVVAHWAPGGQAPSAGEPVELTDGRIIVAATVYQHSRERGWWSFKVEKLRGSDVGTPGGRT